MNQRKLSYSFAPGMKKIEVGHQNCVKNCIMELLGLKNRHEFCRKKAGIVNIPKHIYDEITSIFAKENVPETEVWNIIECSKN